MMTRTQLLSTLLATGSIFLGGCASTSGNLSPATQEQRMAAMAPWVAKGNLIAMELPAASNPLSNQIAIAALKAGSSSNAVDQIVQVLRSGKATTLAVMGNSPALNTATVQAALKQWKASGAHTTVTLLLVGQPEDGPALKESAAAAGLQLEIAAIH